jgi:N-acetyl-anhydromuramyl-L-alanine amidase AmpD
MHHQRRSFLKLTGSAIAGTAALGAGVTDGAAAPAVRYDPAHPSNYRTASRTTADIDWIIIHTIQGPYESAINWFKNPRSDVSSHYVVGEEPGELTQMVRTRDVAWTAGDGGYNARGINIELEGYADSGFSDQLYENLAELVEFLCENYDIPKQGPDFRVAPCNAAAGEGGIIGHVHIPGSGCTGRGGSGGHTDPGPYFDYDRLVDAITGEPETTFELGQEVTATRALNVRSEPEIGFNVRHTNPTGTTGTVIGESTVADQYRFWKVEWDNGVTGWAIQQYMTATENEDDGDDNEEESDEDETVPDDDEAAGDGFKIGQTVVSTAPVNVRSSAEVTNNVTHTQPSAVSGTVKNGYVTEDGFTWWWVHWENGVGGWSVQKHLGKATQDAAAATDADAGGLSWFF